MIYYAHCSKATFTTAKWYTGKYGKGWHIVWELGHHSIKNSSLSIWCQAIIKTNQVDHEPDHVKLRSIIMLPYPDVFIRDNTHYV